MAGVRRDRVDADNYILQVFIRFRIALEAIALSDGWRGYERHLRMKNVCPRAFSKNCVHINGIESFWSFTKRRLAKFNGVSKNFDMYLKECAWRWAKSHDKLIAELKTLLV